MASSAVSMDTAPQGRAVCEAGIDAPASSSRLSTAPVKVTNCTAAARKSPAYIEARTRAWTASFHLLTQDYLTQLSRLVEETIRLETRTSSSGDAQTSRLRWRGQRLGGDAEEDAALELDVGDLRRAERELLRELQAHHNSCTADGQMKDRAATTLVGAADAASAVTTASSRRTSCSSATAAHSNTAPKRTSRVTLQSPATKRSSAVNAPSAGQHKRSSRAESTATDSAKPSDEPPVPESVLELFRHAHSLSAPSFCPTSRASPSPHTTPHHTGANTTATDDAEAEALARLCVKYFLTPKPVPAPVTAPPPLPQVDRPWSSADKHKPSRHGVAQGPISESSPHTQHRSRGEAAVAGPGGIDSSLFPPPDLHTHTQKPLHPSRQGSPVNQQQHSSLTRSSFTHDAGNAADGGGSSGGAPMSLNGPAAWRKLIDKRTAAATAAAATSADQTPLPAISPSPTTRPTPTAARHAHQNAAPPARDENYSFGFPPPRALLTAANASDVLEALSKEEKDGPLSRYLGGRLLQNTSAHTVGRRSEKAPDGTRRLPALQLRQPPPPPTSHAVAAAAPSRSAASSAPHAAAHGGRPIAQHQLSPVAHGGHSQGMPPLKSTRKGKHAAKGPLAPTVVLPPHYHGLHGEKLSTAELEQLVKSVKRERAEAQAGLNSTYEAVDATAEALYALQQSVAQVLLENVQLEKDIATLAHASSSPPRPEEEGERETQRSVSTASTAATHVMPPARRALFTLPGPASAPSPFMTSLLSNTSRGPRRTKTQKKSVKAAPATGKTSLPSTAADRHLDPVEVLEELRAATAACETEQAQTLVEIDALSSRIARHDSLLQAAAEYWRRNAAVMKRQQFAVQSQPKLPSDAIVTWHSGTANSAPNTRGGGDEGESRGSSRSSSTSRMHRHRSGNSSGTSIDRTESSATPSSRVPELSGSPSQLERALAHMEAVSPMQPSSAVSFDLHPSQSRTTENSSVPPTVHLRKRETVRRRGDAAAALAPGDEEGGLEAHSPRTPGGNSNPTPQKQERMRLSQLHRSRVDAVLSDSSFRSYAASSPATAAGTTGTTRTLFSSPDLPSDEDGDKDVPQAAATTTKTKDGDADQPGRNKSALVKDSAALTPSLRTTAPSLMIELVGRRNETRATATFSNFLSNTSASRREEEEVLQVGSWRTISALQLEKVDEIAEFIYSVFERA